jgi:hypothetical protein
MHMLQNRFLTAVLKENIISCVNVHSAAITLDYCRCLRDVVVVVFVSIHSSSLSPPSRIVATHKPCRAIARSVNLLTHRATRR